MDDIYSKVTNKILQDLNSGQLTWLKPWKTSGSQGTTTIPLRHNGEHYNGINVLVLWTEALEKGFVSPIWMTYNQARELGAQVRKGEKGTTVVYANKYTKESTDTDGTTTTSRVSFLRHYTVFNVDQIDNLPQKYHPTPQTTNPNNPIPLIEEFVSNTKATVHHGGNRAFYAPQPDTIQMPELKSFDSIESYYATLGHELVHWTSHEKRLARDFGRQRWGDHGYAMEELVAEIGAAFLCAQLGITPETRPDHAAYIQSWLVVLKNDNRAVFVAASRAQIAVDYLYTLQPKELLTCS